MAKEKEFSWSTKVLLLLLAGIDLMPRPFESKTHYTRRLFSGRLNYKSYYLILKRLEERGYITIYKKDKVLMPALTETGRLQALFEKAIFPEHGPWDGKFRIMIFDIPEETREFRHELRFLLKHNGFKLIQKSVYLSPYPLNQEGIDYLKSIHLDRYISVLRVDKADREEEYKQMFKL